jgi:predicted amidophosphoribosyltransferase
VSHASAIGDYTGVLRDIIHVLKYDGRRSTAPRLAQLMIRHAGEVLAGADAVVPVPLHPRRERERGFNQADDLARGLGLPVSRILFRTRITAPQVELPASARQRNVKDAFAIAGRSKGNRLRTAARTIAVRSGRSSDRPDAADLDGTILVLVDDVTTTGATLDACARVLKQAGAKEIRAITAARVSSARR